MEREIMHTGIIDAQQQQQHQDGLASHPPLLAAAAAAAVAAAAVTSDGSEPRIGGLTIEEFIHFLALLERVKEQHIDSKDDMVASGDDGHPLPHSAERTSPYDNIVRPLPPSEQQQQPIYVNVSTSTRISPPSDDDPSGSSTSSSSSSPCSSSDEDGRFQLSDKSAFISGSNSAGISGFSLLERLFLRRYLHVIPEEAASDCGSHSARLSRALSGLSSALSYLEDLDDDRFSRGSFDEDDDYPSEDPTTPVPSSTDPAIDPDRYLMTDLNLVDRPSDGGSVSTSECNKPKALNGFNPPPLDEDNSTDDTKKSVLPVDTAQPDTTTITCHSPPTEPSIAAAEAPQQRPSTDEFSIVTALPAIVIDSSDDDVAESADEIHRQHDEAQLPRVLEELERCREGEGADRLPTAEAEKNENRFKADANGMAERESGSETGGGQENNDDNNSSSNNNNNDGRSGAESKIGAGKAREAVEEDTEEVTSLADCETLDEWSLPLSVLMIHSSGCRNGGGGSSDDRHSTSTGADSERNSDEPSNERNNCRCPCSLGFSDSDISEDDDDDDDDDEEEGDADVAVDAPNVVVVVGADNNDDKGVDGQQQQTINLIDDSVVNPDVVPASETTLEKAEVVSEEARCVTDPPPVLETEQAGTAATAAAAADRLILEPLSRAIADGRGGEGGTLELEQRRRLSAGDVDVRVASGTTAGVIHPEDEVQTSACVAADVASSVETVAGTSVVTLIDAKIVSVDYEPALERQQLIRSSAQLRHGPQMPSAEQLEALQQPAECSSGNRRLSTLSAGILEQAPSTTSASTTDGLGHDSARTEEKKEQRRPRPLMECAAADNGGVCSSTTSKHARVVEEMRRLWEGRCNGVAPTPSTTTATIMRPDASAACGDLVDNNNGNVGQAMDWGVSAECESDGSATPVATEIEVESTTTMSSSAPTMTDHSRAKSVQEFRAMWSGWPPPPPLPPPPEHYGFSAIVASETETGYSTDGSEPFRQSRRRAGMMAAATPPPRPTPPREENLYRRAEPSWARTGGRRPEPPLRCQPRYFQPLCYYSAPEEDNDDDDERVKARLLADWLVLANRKRSQSPCPSSNSSSTNTYRTIQRSSNYSTMTARTRRSTATTTMTGGSEPVTRDTSARESESEVSDYGDRADGRWHCYGDEERSAGFHQNEWPPPPNDHGSSSSLLSTPYQASSPKPGVWSPGQQPSPPERDNPQQQQQQQQATSSGSQPPPPPVWIPSSQLPSPKAERKEFRPVRLEALKKASPSASQQQQQQAQAQVQATQQQRQQQQQQQQREVGQKSSSGSKPSAPTSLPPFATTTSAASLPYTAATTYSSFSYPWEGQRQQHHVPPVGSANSTPINTPASEHSALTSTSTNYSVLSWDRRTTGSNYSGGGGSGATTPTPSLQPLLPPISTPTSHLPKAPNATVTLLQKAREGQLPKGAAYLENVNNKQGPVNRLGHPPPPQQQLYRSPYEQVYSIQREYSVPSTSSGAACDQNSQQPSSQDRKVVDLTAAKFSGVGPVSQEGVPIALRSGIREEDHHHWYKRMYESLHRAGGPGDYVTVRYKPGRGRGGYLSEPDHLRCDYDSDAGRYATLDRRRQRIHNDSESNGGSPARITNESDYRIQPGRIEDYEPGRSSIAHPSPPIKQSPKLNIPSKSFTNFALKESGYESDSQLVFRRRNPVESAEGGTTTPAADPHEQRLWYRDIQRGGEVPLHGLRKQQPDRPQGAAHRFAESEVTIHYRSPIRNLQQGQNQTEIDEEELRQMQADHMRRVYEQERRRKYLQELEDIESRRHMDNFTPLMKSPIPLNRYDDFMDDQPVPMSLHGSHTQQRDRTPEPKIVARGLYNFMAQNARELSFQKGDIIFVRRQIDKNWYEGEHNAMVGIFPVNYVEIIPYDGVRLTNRKPSEGKARVKFNFVAQTPVELSLVKGELVIITRQVDEHWLEGRIGQRRGIFPVSYVDIIQPCSSVSVPAVKTPTTSGSSLITNGSLRATSNYRNQSQYSVPKSSPGVAMSQHQPAQYRPVQQYKPSSLMIDTRSDPVLYRALYTYAPQNDDELELQEGDMICVLEKCDDGWYVGTSQRTGLFGTFPGNYVERV